MAHGIGLIDLGVMGRRMIARLDEHRGFRITAIWDPQAQACAEAARAAPGAVIATDAAALVKRADTACVYIASLPARRICWRSMPRSRPRGPAKVSRWSPRK